MKPIKVLLVEDNPADADLTRESFNESKFQIAIDVVEDGEEALEYLYKKGKYEDISLPDLILLDLNLPKVHGREILANIKKDDRLKLIPVVVLTSSEAESDILQSYKLGANCYVTKPVDFKAFQYIVSSLEDFWFTVVKLLPSELKH